MGLVLRKIDRPRDYTLCIGPKTSIISYNVNSAFVALDNELISFNFNYSDEGLSDILNRYEFYDNYDLLSIFLYNSFKCDHDNEKNVRDKIHTLWGKMLFDIHKNNLPEIIILNNNKTNYTYRFNKKVEYINKNENRLCRLIRDKGHSYFPMGVEYNDAYFSLMLIGNTDMSTGYHDIAYKIRKLFIEYLIENGFVKNDYFSQKKFLFWKENNRKNLNFFLRNLEYNLIEDKEIVNIIHGKFDDNLIINIHLYDI